MRNGEGNREGNGRGSWTIPERKHRTSKKVRLTGAQKDRAERDGGGSLGMRLVAEMERRIHQPIKCKGKEWYIYNGVKWEKINRECFRPMALDVQELANRNERRAQDVLKTLESKNQFLPGEKFNGAMAIHNGSYLLNFENGTLELDRETGKVMAELEHNSAHMFTCSLGKYIEDSDCLFFKKILREILPNVRDRKLLLNVVTSALLPDSRFEVALFCIGDGANGKSVITEALANALGEDVCSSMKFHQICSNERKQMHLLPGKLLNVATETDTSTISDTSIFKNVVSGEAFQTEVLYDPDGKKVQTFCKFVFLMNKMPFVKHASEGDFRRIRALYFPNHFDTTNRDTMLRDKLRTEREGILAYLVRRLSGLCALDEIPQGSFTSQKVEDNFRGACDIVATFCGQCLEMCPIQISTAKDNIYLVFQKFCQKRDHRSYLSKDQLFKVLRKLYPQDSSRIDWDYRYNAGKFGRMYSVRGLRLSDYGYQLFTINIH